PTLVGFISGTQVVGYYVLADRVRLLAYSTITPISQALFPRLNSLFSSNKEEARSLYVRSAYFLLPISALISTSIFFASEWMVLLLAGNEFANSATLLKILAPAPFLVCASNLLGMQLLIPNGFGRLFNRVVTSVAVGSALSAFLLIYSFGAKGGAVSVVVTELVIAVAMSVAVWKFRTSIFNGAKNAV
ncbi:MAG: oligosaccharide flippase family protein, partial [Pseudomonadota bacterium]